VDAGATAMPRARKDISEEMALDSAPWMGSSDEP
jgi:hypothetical protein